MRILPIAFSLALAAPALAQGTAAPAPSNELGKAVYTKRCAGCHGADGKADTKPGHKYKIADFTEAAWPLAWDRAHVKDVVVKGVPGKMPAWGEKLSPEEIEAVGRYVFQLAGAPDHK